MSLLPGDTKDFYVPQKLKKKELFYHKDKQKKHLNYEIYDIINKHSDIIFIEAEAGFGKSKLLREVVKYYCTQEVFSKEKLIPLFIQFMEFYDSYNCDIKNFIDQQVDSNIINLYKNDLKILICIDGLDEKFQIDVNVNDIVEKIYGDISIVKNLKVIISSRPIHLSDDKNTLAEKTSRYEIEPLGVDGLISFFNHICKQANISARIVEDIKKSQVFKQLPHSPIAAILLANLLNENSKELPSNLTELYQKYSELMLGRWDMRKGLQEQKEYDATLSIILNIAKFFIENDLTAISITEAKNFFIDYLKERNLNINAHDLFDKVTTRSSILYVNYRSNILYFKHRSFVEFYYALYKVKHPDVDFINDRVFSIQWRNIFFFYVGILRDCYDVLHKFLSIVPPDIDVHITKIFFMADYFLAGFATPYKLLEENLTLLFRDLGKLYINITKNNAASAVSFLPEMHVLYLFQALSRNFFSYDFFAKALEIAISNIYCCVDMSEEEKAYALYFIYVIFIDLDEDNPFSGLIEKFERNLPIQIQMAITYESRNMKSISSILKKQNKRLDKFIKQSGPKMRKFISDIHGIPVNKMKQIAHC